MYEVARTITTASTLAIIWLAYLSFMVHLLKVDENPQLITTLLAVFSSTALLGITMKAYIVVGKLISKKDEN